MMPRWTAAALGALAIELGSATANADSVEPTLWQCTGQVTVNSAAVTCGSSKVVLKANDTVVLTSGTALITGWHAELIPIEANKPVRIAAAPAPPASPSFLTQLALVAELIFGGAKRSALMKSNSGSTTPLVQPKLLGPDSLALTSWSGVVCWQVPANSILALRVRLPSGAFAGPAQMLSLASIDLGTLPIGSADSVTLELMILDVKPPANTTPSYLSEPAPLALREKGRPVLAVVSTGLRRISAAERKAIDDLPKTLAGSIPTHRAAVLLQAGELKLARDELQRAAPQGLPEAWQLSVSGVEVQIAP